MIKLQKPDYDAKTVFKKCISKVRSQELKKRFIKCEPYIDSASNEYEVKAKKVKLHTVEPSKSLNGIVTADEMKSVYTYRMAKKGAPGRDFYDKIMAIPKHGRCPFCGQRTVSTLDHYLPKAHFPAFSVAPSNLIPSCKDCNTTKTDDIPTSAEEETLHPYFDDIDDEIWLKADVIEDKPICLAYFVESPQNWSELLSKRVVNHFETFKLATLYASYSAEELINIELINKTIFLSSGADGLQEFLKVNLQSHRRTRKNSWKSALYDALANSDYYFSEYFAGDE